jgi:hypothetical protein
MVNLFLERDLLVEGGQLIFEFRHVDFIIDAVTSAHRLLRQR